MKAVGVRELKNRLSYYLRAVRQGERILVTDRGEVVAELGQPGGYPAEHPLPAGLAALVKSHVLRVGLPNAATAYPLQPSRLPDGTAAKLIDELREDR